MYSYTRLTCQLAPHMQILTWVLWTGIWGHLICKSSPGNSGLGYGGTSHANPHLGTLDWDMGAPHMQILTWVLWTGIWGHLTCKSSPGYSGLGYGGISHASTCAVTIQIRTKERPNSQLETIIIMHCISCRVWLLIISHTLS